MWSGSTTNLLGVVHPGATGGGGCGRFRGALAAVVERAVTGEALGGRENRGGAGVEGATTAAAAAASAAAAAASRYRRDRRPVCQPGVAVVRCAPGIARRLPLHTRVHEALAPARRALLPASIWARWASASRSERREGASVLLIHAEAAGARPRGSIIRGECPQHHSTTPRSTDPLLAPTPCWHRPSTTHLD